MELCYKPHLQFHYAEVAHAHFFAFKKMAAHSANPQKEQRLARLPL